MKRLRHLGHRPGGPAQGETVAPQPRALAPKPEPHAGPSNTEDNSRTTRDTAAANKRKRASYENASAVSNTEGVHVAQKRRRIPQDHPVESDSQLETSDESPSEEYETAPQFPIPEENNLDDDDTLVPITTQEEGKEESGDAEDLDAWIQKRVDSGRKLEDIIQALSCTSMNPELADKVLDVLSKEKRIPSDMQGVWTEADDEALTGQDGRAMERVMNKHGSELFDERWQFLEQSARATQLVAEGQ